MADAPIVALANELAAATPEACDQGGLAHLVKQSQRARGWLDAFDARIAQASARLADQGRCEPPSSLLSGGGRRSSRDAEAAAKRGAVCDLLPSLHDALAAGEVSAGHADAVVKAVKGLDDAGRAELRDLEPTIVAAAQSSSVEEFGRKMSDLGRVLSGDDGVSRHERMRKARKVKRWVDEVTGMCITHLELDPETDAAVSEALDASVAKARAEDQAGDDRSFDQLRADALVGLITGDHDAVHGAGVMVLVDLRTLRDGLHDQSVCETFDGQPVPPETVRRRCCDAGIIPVVLNGDGVPVDIGRSGRLASRVQRRALRAMYRTCAHPGCTVRFADCRIHHVIDWLHGGPTDLANLIPLCSRHHHLVHEGGWSLTLQPDRTITLARPDGTITFKGTTTDVAPSGATHTVDEPVDEHPDEPVVTIPGLQARLTEAWTAAADRNQHRKLGPPTRAPAA